VSDPSAPFKRVLCAVDDSAAGVVAARVAAHLTLPDGVLTLVSVDDTSPAPRVVYPSPVAPTANGPHAARALEAAAAEAEAFHGLWPRRLSGAPVRRILEEADERDATLLVIGSHGYRRAVGFAFGLVGSHLLHEARCSVLVAQAERDPRLWPNSVVVGVDGSAESCRAAAVGRDLAARHGATLRLVGCTGGHLDREALERVGVDVELLRGRPVEVLHRLSEAADLVVVGSRGLHGVRTVGSVSERVAHRSSCSVLVVRTAQ
jgi:nucleotide-binding universal stress UspA family protein